MVNSNTVSLVVNTAVVISPALTVSPTSVVQGAVLSWSATGLTPNGTEEIAVTSGGTVLDLTPNPVASGTGAASGSFTVGTNIPAGSATLTITDVSSGKTASATFTVTAAAPVVGSIAIAVSPNPATVNQSVTVTATVTSTGGALMSGTPVYLFVDGALQGSSVNTNSSGVATFAITPTTAGTYTIFVSSDSAGT